MNAHQWIFTLLQLITVIIGAQITPGWPAGHLWMAVVLVMSLLFLEHVPCFGCYKIIEVYPLFSPSQP